MFQRRNRIAAIVFLAMALFVVLAFQFTTVARPVRAAVCATPTPSPGKVFADGYYDAGCTGGPYIFGGARSDMESAWPQVRDGGFSALRVAVGHKSMTDPNPPDLAFVESGWIIYPYTSRCVYASWRTTGGVDGYYQYSCLADGDISAHDYRVAVKNDNQTQWSFIFDGVVFRTTAPGFTRGATVGCGGEATSSQNAIGVAACWNVRYKNNNLTSWVYLPSHQRRVNPGYAVVDFSIYSWQSYGNNQ